MTRASWVETFWPIAVCHAIWHSLALTLIWQRLPVYPFVQRHSKLPMWSMHSPAFWHGFDSHSLYSKLHSSPAKPAERDRKWVCEHETCLPPPHPNVNVQNKWNGNFSHTATLYTRSSKRETEREGKLAGSPSLSVSLRFFSPGRFRNISFLFSLCSSEIYANCVCANEIIYEPQCRFHCYISMEFQMRNEIDMINRFFLFHFRDEILMWQLLKLIRHKNKDSNLLSTYKQLSWKFPFSIFTFKYP